MQIARLPDEGKSAFILFHLAEDGRLQRERVAAFAEFVADIRTGGYPGPEHVVDVPAGELKAFLDSI